MTAALTPQQKREARIERTRAKLAAMDAKAGLGVQVLPCGSVVRWSPPPAKPKT